jgi:hypothetical protein
MMAVSFFAVGLSELVLLLFGSGLMGLPPGERDLKLLRCPPAGSVLYTEWAERSSGQPGAQGIDGLAADPEIRDFLAAVQQAVKASVEQGTRNGGPEVETAGRHVPPLVWILLNRPGCLYASYDAQAAAEQAAGQPAPVRAAALQGLRVTLVINGGPQADEIAKHLEELVKFMPAGSGQNGLQRRQLPLPVPGVSLMLHRHEDYFILGLGQDTVDAAVAGLSGQPQGLAASVQFASALNRVHFDRTASVTWLDVKSALAAVVQAAGPQGAMIQGVAAMIGAETVESYVAATGVVDGQIQSRSFITTGGKTEGILSLAAGRAMQPSDFERVPADADFVFAFSLNLPKVLAAVREIVGKADPESTEQFEALIRQLEGELGLSLEDDLFQAFGDVWTLYDSPGGGGFLATGLVASLEVKDPQKASAVFKKMMDIIQANVDGERNVGNGFRRRGVVLAEREFLDRTIYFLNSIGPSPPFAPAFCLTDKQMLVSLHPQTLKSHLRFLQADGETFASRVGTDIPVPEGDLLMLSFSDTKRLAEFLYALVPYAGQTLVSQLQAGGVDLDVFTLPSARAVLPYDSDSTSTLVRTPEGLLSNGKSGFPIPGAGGLLMNVPGLFFWSFGTAVHRVEAGRVLQDP